MANEIIQQLTPQQGEIILYQPDETVRLEVRVEDETVWLSQQQMAELFGTGRQAITKHLQNIYECEELKKDATSSILELVRKEGNRMVKRKIEFYNLDAIISVGFRVNTKRGIEFRQWANSVLKQYLLKGYAVNQRMFDIEQKVVEQGLEIKELRKKVDFFVRSSMPPVEGIFYDGQIFDAYAQIVGLIKHARRSILLIDNYIDETTLTMLSKRDVGVSATIYTRPLSQQQQLDVQQHNRQYAPITVNICQHNHDRFLIIDDEVYVFGASLKDAGKKLFAYIKMQETSATDLLGGIR
ncbi:MAG: virulence RhuM family protein [Prevotella sp.]|nr:virulence RhuM family protein [Prevotella sp.]